MSHTRRRVHLALTILLLALLTACVPWGPLSSSYDGRVRVRGQGAVRNNRSVSVLNEYTYSDPLRDGNSVYVYSAFDFWKYSGICGCTKWYPAGAKSSPEIANRDAEWSNFPYLDAAGSRARVGVRVCAQMGWPAPDSCSPEAVPTIDY